MVSILLRGGGDLGSGIALRLHRCGFQITIAEIAQPLVLRRTVSFANAIYSKEMTVEGVAAIQADSSGDVEFLHTQRIIPVLIDPDLRIKKALTYDILIDARMQKKEVLYGLTSKPFIIGLGPGFSAGLNCHAVIETNRGHFLGRVIWSGSPQADTGIPGKIGNQEVERIIRSPSNGIIHDGAPLGTLVKAGDLVATVDEQAVIAPFAGCLRGLMHDGLSVTKGLKIGDIDPRNDSSLIHSVSEKSLAIAGGVLEAILSTGRFHSWN